MGCNESKGCLINGDGMSSHYTYHHHNLGRKTTTTSTTPPIRMPSVLHGPDIEIQGKTGNDVKPHNHAVTRSLLGGSEEEEARYPNFVEAPSFKDYLISSSSSSNNDDDHHHITNDIINYDGSSDSDDDDDVEEEVKRRIETPDNSAYASAGEAFPIPMSEEPANKNDAIVGEVCLLHKQRQSVHEGDAIVGEACMLPPRDSMVKKRKVKGRRHERS